MPEDMKAGELLPLVTEVRRREALERQDAIVGSSPVDSKRPPSFR
jgi:hypothetical protein